MAGEYTGGYENGMYHGQGTFLFPDDKAKYVGNFEMGYFHGEGSLIVKGGSYTGLWERGNLVEGGFVFEDGLHHMKIGETSWEYCTAADRRFHSEIIAGHPKEGPFTNPSPNLANYEKIPDGCFDTIDGYFNPKKQSIYDYETSEEIRMVEKEERDWIVKYCRLKQ